MDLCIPSGLRCNKMMHRIPEKKIPENNWIRVELQLYLDSSLAYS